MVKSGYWVITDYHYRLNGIIFQEFVKKYWFFLRFSRNYIFVFHPQINVSTLNYLEWKVSVYVVHNQVTWRVRSKTILDIQRKYFQSWTIAVHKLKFRNSALIWRNMVLKHHLVKNNCEYLTVHADRPQQPSPSLQSFLRRNRRDVKEATSWSALSKTRDQQNFKIGQK